MGKEHIRAELNRLIERQVCTRQKEHLASYYLKTGHQTHINTPKRKWTFPPRAALVNPIRCDLNPQLDAAANTGYGGSARLQHVTRPEPVTRCGPRARPRHRRDEQRARARARTDGAQIVSPRAQADPLQLFALLSFVVLPRGPLMHGPLSLGGLRYSSAFLPRPAPQTSRATWSCVGSAHVLADTHVGNGVGVRK